MLLATARGSGVLVWDASGSSLSPLLGRLGHDGRHPPAMVMSAAGSNTAPNHEQHCRIHVQQSPSAAQARWEVAAVRADARQ